MQISLLRYQEPHKPFPTRPLAGLHFMQGAFPSPRRRPPNQPAPVLAGRLPGERASQRPTSVPSSHQSRCLQHWGGTQDTQQAPRARRPSPAKLHSMQGSRKGWAELLRSTPCSPHSTQGAKGKGTLPAEQLSHLALPRQRDTPPRGTAMPSAPLAGSGALGIRCAHQARAAAHAPKAESWGRGEAA